MTTSNKKPLQVAKKKIYSIFNKTPTLDVRLAMNNAISENRGIDYVMAGNKHSLKNDEVFMAFKELANWSEQQVLDYFYPETKEFS